MVSVLSLDVAAKQLLDHTREEPAEGLRTEELSVSPAEAQSTLLESLIDKLLLLMRATTTC